MSKRNKLEELLRKLRGQNNPDDPPFEEVEEIPPELVEAHINNATLLAEMERRKSNLRKFPDLVFAYRPGITGAELLRQMSERLYACEGENEHNWVSYTIFRALIEHVSPDRYEDVSKELMYQFLVK